MKQAVRTAIAVATLGFSFTLASDAVSADAVKDMKDKDYRVRIAAIETIEKSGGPESEALLVDALRDKDWQVIEKAAEVLGKKGGPGAVQDLVNLATEGPIRRIRIIAARSAGAIDATRAIEALGRKLNGDQVRHALEALGAITKTAQNEAAAKVIEDALKPQRKYEKELEKPSGCLRPRDPVRRCAAGSLTAFPVAARAARIEKLMFDEDVGVACAALETIIEVPDPVFLPLLVSGLSAPKVDDCVERRLRNCVRAVVAMKPPGPESLALADPVLKAAASASAPEAAMRLARVIGELAKRPKAAHEPTEADKDAKEPVGLITSEAAMAALGPAINHADPKVRSAAAAALAKVASPLAMASALKSASDDPDAHVRVIALRSVASVLTASDDRALTLFVGRLSDTDPLVREEAAVALGVKGVSGAIPSLTKVVEEAVADKGKDKKSSKWALGTVALVSMGKTQDAAAVEPLRKAYHDAADWRLKASAVVGLGRVQKSAAVDDLIDALDDKEPSIHNTAYEFLRRMTTKEIPPDSKSWRAWWKATEPKFEFLDREEEYRKAQKYGYAPSIEGLYEGLDIVVLATRGGGDRIEDLLDVLKINHRLCRQPKVTESGLHPYALFVANCPGEIGQDDVEALSWYVRSGGYLFSSCWALHETVEKIYPGMVKRFLTPTAQVIDYNDRAEPCVPDSPYLDGVFDSWTTPMYVLEGAHLIELMDRDRVEVLIDSPDTSTAWGVGNLACWFTAGHGVILDSVNHFNHQGFHFATGLKTAEDRAAYAMDHMGITYSDLRDFTDRKVFENSGRCAKEVTDESAFRFISNFVRYKRRLDL